LGPRPPRAGTRAARGPARAEHQVSGASRGKNHVSKLTRGGVPLKRFVGLLFLFAAVGAAAVVGGRPWRQARTEAEMRAAPRDVREIFLTLPYPSRPEKDSAAEYYADFMDTYEKRLRLLERPFAKPGEYENTVDTANGYLRLNLTDNWGQYVVLKLLFRSFLIAVHDGERIQVSCWSLRQSDSPHEVCKARVRA
jgi:hypothetical protein